MPPRTFPRPNLGALRFAEEPDQQPSTLDIVLGAATDQLGLAQKRRAVEEEKQFRKDQLLQQFRNQQSLESSRAATSLEAQRTLAEEASQRKKEEGVHEKNMAFAIEAVTSDPRNLSQWVVEFFEKNGMNIDYLQKSALDDKGLAYRVKNDNDPNARYRIPGLPDEQTPEQVFKIEEDFKSGKRDLAAPENAMLAMFVMETKWVNTHAAIQAAALGMGLDKTRAERLVEEKKSVMEQLKMAQQQHAATLPKWQWESVIKALEGADALAFFHPGSEEELGTTVRFQTYLNADKAYIAIGSEVNALATRLSAKDIAGDFLVKRGSAEWNELQKLQTDAIDKRKAIAGDIQNRLWNSRKNNDSIISAEIIAHIKASLQNLTNEATGKNGNVGQLTEGQKQEAVLDPRVTVQKDISEADRLTYGGMDLGSFLENEFNDITNVVSEEMMAEVLTEFPISDPKSLAEGRRREPKPVSASGVPVPVSQTIAGEVGMQMELPIAIGEKIANDLQWLLNMPENIMELRKGIRAVLASIPGRRPIVDPNYMDIIAKKRRQFEATRLAKPPVYQGGQRQFSGPGTSQNVNR